MNIEQWLGEGTRKNSSDVLSIRPTDVLRVVLAYINKSSWILIRVCKVVELLRQQKQSNYLEPEWKYKLDGFFYLNQEFLFHALNITFFLSTIPTK